VIGNATTRTADFVILGAGVMGASIAFHLARRKAGSVAVLDKDHVGSGGSSRSSALVRMHYSFAPEVQLALVSLKMFQHWREVVGEAGARWEGHAGATRFYMELLGAIPDIHFDLQQIVIGPQGVCEEATVTGTQQGKWLSHPPTGTKVDFRVVIYFPWDQRLKKFTGERVFLWS